MYTVCCYYILAKAFFWCLKPRQNLSLSPQIQKSSSLRAFQLWRCVFMGHCEGATPHLKDYLNSLLQSILHTKLSVFFSQVPEVSRLVHVLWRNICTNLISPSHPNSVEGPICKSLGVTQYIGSPFKPTSEKPDIWFIFNFDSQDLLGYVLWYCLWVFHLHYSTCVWVLSYISSDFSKKFVLSLL